MPYKETNNTIIMYSQDVKSLNIDLNRLEMICNEKTLAISGLIPEKVSKKLRNYIEKRGTRLEADLAVIYCQGDIFGLIHQRDYDVKFYRYPLQKNS